MPPLRTSEVEENRSPMVMELPCSIATRIPPQHLAPAPTEKSL